MGFRSFGHNDTPKPGGLGRFAEAIAAITSTDPAASELGGCGAGGDLAAPLVPLNPPSPPSRLAGRMATPANCGCVDLEGTCSYEG